MEFLVRLSGEITIKSPPVRKRFQKRLIKNLKHGLKNKKSMATIEPKWDRLFIKNGDEASISVLEKTFGVSSFSVLTARCSASLPTILEISQDKFKNLVENKTFAIRARRCGDHDFSSMDIQKQVGAVLNSPKSSVNLNNPEIQIFIEVRDQNCYFFTSARQGPGGLPIGTGGKGLCLISGGFDSPLAAWMMMKRGLELDFLLFNQGGSALERSVLNLTKSLWQTWGHGYESNFQSVDFSKLQTKLLSDEIPQKYIPVLLKRMFYRCANMCAENHDALITGEVIGQVSSQTLKNLAVIDKASEIIVLRPLLGLDKHEIIEKAKQIDTASASEKIQEFCQLSKAKPATSSSVSQIQQLEADIDYTDLMLQEVNTRKNIKLNSISYIDSINYTQIDHIPEDSYIIDCRELSEFANKHIKGASHYEFYDLIDVYKVALCKEKTYLIYCSFGTKSSTIAEKMQRDGYTAYSLKNGLNSHLYLLS